MSAQEKRKQLPHYAVLDPESVEHYATSTRLGRYGLLPSEVFWSQRHRYLEESGYLLRPRYAPNWKPSWTGTNLDPMYCEDAIMLKHHQLIDARRRKDNELVSIKRFRRDSEELHIAQFLTTLKDKSKHAVPVYAVLPDPFDNRLSLMIMPYLRPCNNPAFGTIGEVIEFIDQMIEVQRSSAVIPDCSVFMGPHRVLSFYIGIIAHRDIALVNIMMDAKPLYPDGHHPVRLQASADALYDATPLPRTGRSIRYYYIDFGFSVKFPEGTPSLVVGDIGRDAEVPELSPDIPYDVFPVDIYALGNLLFKHFEHLYNSMEFLLPLIEKMKRLRPELRPTANQVLQEWEHIRGDLNESLFRWRLGPKSEPAIERMFKDTIAAAWEGVFRLRKLVG